MILEAYFDESGIHDQAQVCVVGGFYATQTGWRNFERQWNAIIEDYPELANCGFHAKKFFRRENEKRVEVYKGWPDEEADKLLERLSQAIMRNRIFPIGYGIVVKDFKALSLESRKWFTGAKFRISDGKAVTSGCPNKPYYVPFSFCVIDSSRAIVARTKIHFFAGIDRSFSGYARTLYNYLTVDNRLPESTRSALGGLNFPLAKDTPGIQAADLLVHQMYRFAFDEVATKRNLPLPNLLARLRKNKKPNQLFPLLNKKLLNDIEESGKAAFQKLLNEARQ